MAKDIELPLGKRKPLYRFFEILPGATSLLIIVLLFVFSIISPVMGAVYLLIIIITTVVKAIGVAIRTLQGHGVLIKATKVDWKERLKDLEAPHDSYERLYGKRRTEYGFDEHLENLQMMAAAEDGYFPKPSNIYNAVIITMYDESLDILEPTFDVVKNTTYDRKHMIVVLAYEERGGPEAEERAEWLQRKYSKYFGEFLMIKHPDGIKGEVIGKGPNIAYAGKRLKEVVREKGLRFADVIVTTLDSDNRPHECYFDYLTYEYIVHEDRKRLAYQPVSLFMNNIWDAPAPMRIVATTNSFLHIICSMRPHVVRNFASHSQPLDALVEMDFWSTRTIVEDGHQYWRSLFYFDGDYAVLPIHAPVYQDAVLSDGIWRTFKAQFVQLRRWYYGASDIAYVGVRLFSRKRRMSFVGLFMKFARLLDGHIMVASAALIVAFGGWVPLIMTSNQSREVIQITLPNMVFVIQLIATAGLFITIAMSMRMLPKRPSRYKPYKKLVMLLQWILMPIVSIIYSSFTALYAQARLMSGKYMEKFDVTHKVVKK